MCKENNNIILEGKNLTKTYSTKQGPLTACNNINFKLQKGETLGIVGESGCGKSTVLKLITKIEDATNGNLFFKGENITSLKGKELRNHRPNVQMVFQDSTLSFFEGMKIGDAISEPIRNFHKLSKLEIDEKVNELLELVHLPKDYKNRYPKTLSGGQRQRVGIARALALNPEVLVCDEATSSLDVSVQEKIIDLLTSIQKKRGLSMVFVCHDISLVQSLSHNLMVMYLGSAVEILPMKNNGMSKVCHPYTKSLVSSIFTIDVEANKIINPLEGDLPDNLNVPVGCSFHTRCKEAIEICKEKNPELIEIEKNHFVACHLYN